MHSERPPGQPNRTPEKACPEKTFMRTTSEGMEPCQAHRSWTCWPPRICPSLTSALKQKLGFCGCVSQTHKGIYQKMWFPCWVPLKTQQNCRGLLQKDAHGKFEPDKNSRRTLPQNLSFASLWGLVSPGYPGCQCCVFPLGNFGSQAHDFASRIGIIRFIGLKFTGHGPMK